MTGVRRVLVLGGYGLIGSACLRALKAQGFEVTGMGRSARSAEAVAPDIHWHIRDIGQVSVDDWRVLLDGVDAVVNASGALQDGARDDLEAIHVTALSRIAGAAEGRALRFVQISAAGVSEIAGTEFFRSKARGDAVVAGMADHVILRPTLVLAPEAYGGTALLRAACAMPGVMPRILPDAPVQTVFIDDLAAAVVAAVRGDVTSGLVADLTGPEVWTFPDLSTRIRRWLGLPPAPWTPSVPYPLLRIGGAMADALGHLGWRSPLRTTALKALAEGIRGDPAVWNAAGAHPCRGLEATLAAMPATRQDVTYARMFLALPLAIGVLALFWLVSGLVALADPGAAAEVLTSRGTNGALAMVLVLGGAVTDIALGAAILWRRATRLAAAGMVAVSLAYMAGAALLAPDLWADPLGAMVKVIPGMALAIVVWLGLETR
ncbi:oxidoreductase [Oceanicola sp. 22II-s10i]|uniref:SDR family oxidoreductase n=1 Tax=Oceanicola sp. 22II-s10i TaxID=1317116 RepID=UPI000B523B50|nr:SDR family oxidoreductase [Oceanicola sp. 22II-s10i]OWU84861.1 oxidoreductase [Oceanicola sp. 22II-s10i]